MQKNCISLHYIEEEEYKWRGKDQHLPALYRTRISAENTKLTPIMGLNPVQLSTACGN